MDELCSDLKICDDNHLINRIAKVDQILVGHPKLLAAFNGVMECISWSKVSKEARGAVILGEGGTGKTTVCKTILKRFPQRDELIDGAWVKVVPAFFCSVPAATSLGDLIESLLRGLGDPFPEYGKPKKKRERLIKLLEECRTQVILLDEFHHLANTSTPGMRRSVQLCEWLIGLTNETHVMLCLVGIPSCENLVNFDPQMSRRFADIYRLGDLSLGTREKPGDFVPYLRTICKHAATSLELEGFPDLQDFGFVARVWAATAGRPAYISILFRDAVLAALRDKRERVMVDDFSVAFDRGCMAKVALTSKNPFLLTQQKLIASIASRAEEGN